MLTTYVLPLLSGAFAANAVPHLVHGLSGRWFRTPFARLMGDTESSPVTNAIWGWVNAAVAYALFSLAAQPVSVGAFGLGALVSCISLALIFSRDDDG